MAFQQDSFQQDSLQIQIPGDAGPGTTLHYEINLGLSLSRMGGKAFGILGALILWLSHLK